MRLQYKYMENRKKHDWLLPISILVAAILISFAFVYSVGSRDAQTPASLENATGVSQGTSTLPAISPVSADDHILGSSTAKIIVVEYTDLECPFCKEFHNTMQQVLSAYGSDVALVFRNFPIAELHSKAPNEAQAAECAATLGGNDVFWAYVNRLFDTTPSNNGLDPAELPTIAQYVGLNVNDFNTCLSSNETAPRVNADIKEGDAVGIQNIGTPYSVVFVNGVETAVIPGAYTFDMLKPAFDKLLGKN